MIDRSKIAGAGLLTAALWLAPLDAAAHIQITSHVPRHGPEFQKAPPCGLAGAEGPGSMVYTYKPGQPLTIAWHEFIDHPGHYRVSFDPEGDAGFVDPATADDFYNNDTVLLDNIPDEPGVHDYEVEITLPLVECDFCTIQVLQVMTDKPPFGDGNDIYYHCIDVRLVAEGSESGDGDSDDPGDGDPGDGDPGEGDLGETGDPGETGETEPAADGPDEGCACTSAPKRAGSFTLLALLALGSVRSRRRRSLVDR
jgi:MYXO-CTERM domain-containing protein